ncbi:DUF4296 domain-containing protein [Marinoscillum pacificum]|uniref:DUF4296 domain-containing protein n=1 Tax=Marinoscillum pacificum TaxID=392723 RepID=UPI0021587C0B|nr:DUF4296 domain-containing protein [Marinoscillum pacificum]
MRNSFFIVLALLIFVNCSKKQAQRPPNVLTRDQMVRVLIDVHILEAKIKKLYLPRDSSQLIYNHYEGMLFDDLGITKEQYAESTAYYIDEIDEMKDIYNQVVDSLLARQKLNNAY